MDSGYTQPDLAEIAGMTAIAVHRYEQFVYARPSNNYIAALHEISGVPLSELRESYQEARKAQVSETVNLFTHLFTSPDYSLNTLLTRTPSIVLHPYLRFRQGVCLALDQPESAMNWCVLTCFHPAQLYKFESSGKSIPAAQRKILEASQMPLSDIKRLNNMIRDFMVVRNAS